MNILKGKEKKVHKTYIIRTEIGIVSGYQATKIEIPNSCAVVTDTKHVLGRVLTLHCSLIEKLTRVVKADLINCDFYSRCSYPSLILKTLSYNT